MQEVLPSHVQQAMDEAWVANLEQQVLAWKTARHPRHSVDHAGVLVVRRSARHPAGRVALHATDGQAL